MPHLASHSIPLGVWCYNRVLNHCCECEFRPALPFMTRLLTRSTGLIGYESGSASSQRARGAVSTGQQHAPDLFWHFHLHNASSA